MIFPRPKTIIAHRGAPKLAQENTLESFSIAVESGAHMIEFDLRKTVDGSIVVHHDPYISFQGIDYNLEKITHKELNSIAGKKSYTVPSFTDVLRIFSGKTTFDIEIKEYGYEEEIIEIVDKFLKRQEYIFTSFNISVVNKLRRLSKESKVGLLIENSELLMEYGSAEVDLFCPSKNLYCSHKDFFTSVHKRGLSTAVWTVNSDKLLETLISDPCVDAIITNRCRRALQLLSI
jgi:glycerophosphoryl diester phosphodiesterase